MTEAGERDLDIAIVGMAGRFPGARSISEFWQILREGLNTTQRLAPEELRCAGVPERELSDPHYVPVWSGLDDVDLFDAEFFGYSPAEAELIDPQQRLFLECVWEAMEDAGHDPAEFHGEIAVYAATGMNTYLMRQLLPDENLVRAAGQFALAVASDKDNLSTRVSYKLGLTGPSLTVQSNCSSGMVALHHAVGTLLDGQSDMAVVGAVSIKGREPRGYLAEPGGVSSFSGEVRAFDARADGYFLGDAVAVIVIRRYLDAIADGDQIYGVIRGTAASNDGSAKAGFVAPGKIGQVKAIRTALAMARVDPGTVDYVEANGSGTLMGDAIEVAALLEAYGWHSTSGTPHLIGSLKPNFGNLDTVSGLASLMKAVLALRHAQLPPTIQYEQPNPQCALGTGAIRVNDTLRPWAAQDGSPRRAGVSSFGVGGTNVHAIVEEAAARPTATSHGWHLVLVSARTTAGLDRACRRMSAHIERRTDQALADIAYTSQVGRRSFEHRAFVVASQRGEAARALLAAADAANEAVPGDTAQVIAALRGADPVDQAYREGLTLLGRLWRTGAAVPWRRLHEGSPRSKVSLPAYPFERERFWHEPSGSAGDAVVSPTEEATKPLNDRPAMMSATFVPPSGLLQDAVAQVWRRRLGLSQIGVNDSFLELGGDSLIAARIANEVAESLHVEPNLRAFLESPTIASMAHSVDEQLARGAELRTLLAEFPEGAD